MFGGMGRLEFTAEEVRNLVSTIINNGLRMDN